MIDLSAAKLLLISVVFFAPSPPPPPSDLQYEAKAGEDVCLVMRESPAELERVELHVQSANLADTAAVEIRDGTPSQPKGRFSAEEGEKGKREWQDRQTDRQTGRQAGRQADRQTDRQTDRTKFFKAIITALVTSVIF